MHPILFRLPFLGLPVYSYGFMLGLSFAAGCALAYLFARRDGYARSVSLLALFWAVAGSLLGARILFFLVNPGRLDGVLGFFSYHRGGLVAYGGFFGGIVGAWASLRLRGLRFLRFADHTAPPLALGLALTRIGCLLAGCNYGKPADLPWSVTFRPGSPAFEHHLDAGLIPANATRSLPVHPTQVYESLCGILIFTVLLALRRRGRLYHGQAFILFLGLYSVFRFFNEILRGDLQRGSFWIFSTSQWLALAVVAVTATAGVVLSRRARTRR